MKRKFFFFDIDGTLVPGSGQSHVPDGTLRGIEPLPRDLCIELADECEAAGLPWACCITDTTVRTAVRPEYVAPLTDPYQACRFDPDFDIHAQPKILRMFVSLEPGAEANVPALGKLPWMRYAGMPYIFVEPADKARGIRRIMKTYGATDEDVVVFGDELNDLSMFLPEWTCICMGNGRDELKARADFVTRDSDDDGIGYALRHFGWID